MKKLFLCTTVLTASLFVADAMAASGPKITVGGVADAQIGVVDQDIETGVDVVTDQDVIFRNDNEIHFSIDGKTEGGLEYGAVIQLEADVNDEQSGGVNADRTYVYLQGANWGRLEFGSNDAASDTLKLDADTFSRGTGGIGGDSRYYINNTAIVATATASATQAIIRPDLPLGNQFGVDAGEEYNKVTYYTPNFQGFQAGVSYTPNSANVGQSVNGLGAVEGVENVISIAAKYEGQFDQFGFGVAAAVDMGDAVDATAATYSIEDLMAWNVGANFSFAGFTIGGSYSDQDDSLMTSNFESTYYTAAVAYANEQFGASVGYFASEVDDSANLAGVEFENIVISADYNLAPGILPYAEVAIFDIDSDVAANDNEGTVFLIGTELTF